MRRAVLLTLALAACRESRPPRSTTLHGTARARLAAPPPPAPDGGALAAADAGVAGGGGVADVRTWPFVEYARRWCLPDRLAQTQYLLKWVPQSRAPLPDGDPEPDLGRFLPCQRRGAEDATTPEDHQRLLTWQSLPRKSHVMDCALRVEVPGVDPARVRSSSYAVYLPADYLDHPERPRPLLLLVSGGNGNRSRWFLTPSSDEGVVPGTGGLEVRRRVDAWAAAHPGAATPIVVGLDGSSDQFPNGMSAFLERELPEHLLATYLPGHARSRIPVGVESISSGAAEVALALRRTPTAFQTVGFLSPYAHPSGLDLATTFGTAAERTRLFRALAARHREGLFAARFSVGHADDHLARARAFYDALAAEGLFPRAEAPAYSDCTAEPPSGWHCTATWPGFVVYPHVAHHYRALIPAFPPQFEWELDTLSAMLPRLQGGAAPARDGGVSPTP